MLRTQHWFHEQDSGVLNLPEPIFSPKPIAASEELQILAYFFFACEVISCYFGLWNAAVAQLTSLLIV